MDPVQCTATLPAGSGLCNSCSALPHRPWATGRGLREMHCHIAYGEWKIELLQ